MNFDKRIGGALGFSVASIMTTAALAGLLLFTAAPKAHAESPEECQHRIQHADHELHEAIERHGRDSREAADKRQRLHEARERCWQENHRWWDEDEHRWHDQQDYNDRDHDRDHY